MPTGHATNATIAATTGGAGSRRHTGPVPGAASLARRKEGATVIPMSAQELKLRGQSYLAPVTLHGGGGQGLPGQSPLPPNPVGQTRT